MTIIAKVKRIRSRSSGTFHVLANAEIIELNLSVEVLELPVFWRVRSVYMHREEVRKHFPSINKLFAG
jgi:hypothetical protein